MIIHQLKLQNFGVYGEQTFDLTPQPCNGFNRPIILLRGKNGSGKTTLIEAIRLCLHGSLVLGSRVSRAAYEEYLAQRIHVPLEANGYPTKARIELSLNYVSEGQKRIYEIKREWEVVQGNVREYVHILENEKEIDDLQTREQRDSFLRELIPPGVADLFFFDGERLYTLAENGTSSDLLAETIKSLLGLNLVEQLQKDLDIYLSRQRAKQGQQPLQDQLYELTEAVSALERERSDLRADQRANKKAIAKARRAIARQEQQIASEGSWFAERLGELKQRRERLEAEIDLQRRQAQELTHGLVPFAVAPQMCSWVAERLHLEAEYEQDIAAQRVLADQIEQVSGELEKPEFWADTGLDVSSAARRKILVKLTSTLRRTIQPPDISEREIILRVSVQDRQTLLNWIDLATTQVPQEFCQAIDYLNNLERELEQVNQEMLLVPADETLGPLVEVLQQLNRELGGFQKTASDLEEQARSLDYRLEQMGYQRERLRRQIVEQEQSDQRVQLVGKMQFALEEYARNLQQEKIGLLEENLVARFNDLCCKEDLVDAIGIDPVTFEITLYRQGHPFGSKQLSAGERQLLAMATMWALKEASGAPMPVIVDAPLGRLDSDHRLSVAHNYFPRASHQVILLPTDTEVDDQMLAWLAPAISRAYYLEYDASQGKTIVREDVLAAPAVSEEVTAR
jgi:DNA sulfur modification protein DndD